MNARQCLRPFLWTRCYGPSCPTPALTTTTFRGGGNVSEDGSCSVGADALTKQSKKPPPIRWRALSTKLSISVRACTVWQHDDQSEGPRARMITPGSQFLRAGRYHRYITLPYAPAPSKRRSSL